MHPVRRSLAGLTGVCVLLAAGISAQGTLKQPDLLAAAAANEFGGSATLPSETIAVAKDHGLDYPRVVRAAGKGDVAALRRVMRFSVGNGLDAASAEGHAAVVGELLRRVGDAKFASAMRRESVAVRKAVTEYVLYDTGLSPRELKRRYLRTRAAAVLRSGFGPDHRYS
jgi:hypothetical protein